VHAHSTSIFFFAGRIIFEVNTTTQAIHNQRSYIDDDKEKNIFDSSYELLTKF
jgi:hypothetical protein